jgi:hypothetical protein
VLQDVHVCQVAESVAEISVSPFDDSIAMMTPSGVIRLAHRRSRHMTWTTELLADGKLFESSVSASSAMFFSTKGQLLAVVDVDEDEDEAEDEAFEIWDPIKGKCLKTIFCGDIEHTGQGVISSGERSEVAFLHDGSLVAVTSPSHRGVPLHCI